MATVSGKGDYSSFEIKYSTILCGEHCVGVAGLYAEIFPREGKFGVWTKEGGGNLM